jgi:glycine/D-amino acid oxidase-like deaminating enzyme
MHVVICGGGVIGACTAYFLSRRGIDVTVVECSEIAANTEQSSARGNQHRADVVSLAQFRHAKVELTAEVAVNRIATVGLVEDEMREAAVDRAFEARCGDCQTH